VNASSTEDLILNRSANGSATQALINIGSPCTEDLRMMLTHKDAKSMAKFLRDALGNRNVQLSHGDCLEIVARQFGLADWNTLAAKLPTVEARHTRSRDTAETSPASSVQPATPWGPCSFCGKSAPEVRILLGGCGGWEGFRARRNPESGERSNAWICNECVALIGRMANRNGDIAVESQVT
jgi:hypothetical protein